jgi:lipoprotein-anchoring transpeptidase ErfK/SrfK
LAQKKTTRRRAKPKKRKPRKTEPKSRFWLFLCLCVLALIGAVYYWPQIRTTEKTDSAPPSRAIADTTELQIALARCGFSPGSIDGMTGTQTRLALLAYQTAQGLPLTGSFDTATAGKLKIQTPVFTQRRLSQQDFLQVGLKPHSWRARRELDRMRYNSILEMVAEQAQTDPDFIASLNPHIDWSQLNEGAEIHIPRLPPFHIHQPAAYTQIQLSKRTLQVFSAENRLLFHCPVSIARRVDKRPSGELRVKVLVNAPNYTFNPAILSSTARREGITQKFIIQPGPNNPVGSAWIGLNLPSYGIHGTPEPEKVGRSESSGSFRLANWNAHTLLDAAWVNMPIHIQP